MTAAEERGSVAIIGGGLAGLSAAAALCQAGRRVELFEARGQLGGRAGSLSVDGGEVEIDHCQHVAMGCCVNFLDFMRQAGLENQFRRDRQMHLIGPDGRVDRLAASRWAPAPFHLLPSLLRFRFLSIAERFSVVRAMARLARLPDDRSTRRLTVGEWLVAERQSPRTIRRFWSTVLVSALGESLDRASLAAAKKVFVDGMMADRTAYELIVPQTALAEIHDRKLACWLEKRGATIHRRSPVEQVCFEENRFTALELADGSRRLFDDCIVAVAWPRIRKLLGSEIAERWRTVEGERAIDLDAVAAIPSAPISSLHFWLDRPIMRLPHAALVDQTTQWLFYHGVRPTARDGRLAGHYYQAVVSASYDLMGRKGDEIAELLLGEMAAALPSLRLATVIDRRWIAQASAVFSVRPAVETIRPPQQTPTPNLFLAGDWTQTGWPATMEGAVRSGRLAAEALINRSGTSARLCLD